MTLTLMTTTTALACMQTYAWHASPHLCVCGSSMQGDFGHYVEATLRAMGGTEALEASCVCV